VRAKSRSGRLPGPLPALALVGDEPGDHITFFWWGRRQSMDAGTKIAGQRSSIPEVAACLFPAQLPLFRKHETGKISVRPILV
jgi:hypothetical protein